VITEYTFWSSYQAQNVNSEIMEFGC